MRSSRNRLDSDSKLRRICEIDIGLEAINQFKLQNEVLDENNNQQYRDVSKFEIRKFEK